MRYLYWYFGIGVVVILVIYISHRSTRNKDKPNLHKIQGSHDPDKDKRHSKLKEQISFWLFGVTLASWVWPVFIYWEVQELISKKNRVAEQIDQEFSVSKSDLIERMSVHEIEELERVIDPLGAVPALPFGHLNPAWEKFKANAQNEDEYWTFQTTWNRGWNKRECLGYAILRGNEVSHHFLTGWTRSE